MRINIQLFFVRLELLNWRMQSSKCNFLSSLLYPDFPKTAVRWGETQWWFPVQVYPSLETERSKSSTNKGLGPIFCYEILLKIGAIVIWSRAGKSRIYLFIYFYLFLFVDLFNNFDL
jgi:hypothetical protein